MSLINSIRCLLLLSMLAVGALAGWSEEQLNLIAKISELKESIEVYKARFLPEYPDKIEDESYKELTQEKTRRKPNWKRSTSSSC
jgi:hypothetical protein